MKAGEQVEIYGDGDQSRDFTYIENVIEANLKSCLAPKEACGQGYNIAFGERFSINEIYHLMCEQLNVNLKPKYVEPRAGDIKHSLADISNAKEFLSYNPNWSFKDGFIEAINWYKENL